MVWNNERVQISTKRRVQAKNSYKGMRRASSMIQSRVSAIFVDPPIKPRSRKDKLSSQSGGSSNFEGLVIKMGRQLDKGDRSGFHRDNQLERRL